MAVSSGSLTSFAGSLLWCLYMFIFYVYELIRLFDCIVHPKLLFKIRRAHPIRRTFGSRHKIISFPQNLERRGGATRYVKSVGSNHLEFTYDDDVSEKSHWSTKLKEFLRGLRFLLAFLAEQPGQLKYIEWPSFQSTLKTATLTLVIVALLIAALSSVDGGLSYLLALYLRRNSGT